MLTRRGFLALGSLAAIGVEQSIAAAAQPHWPKYHEALSIDGESGCGLLFLADNDATIPKELEAIEASGLRGILFSVGPNGRFWLDDAQFEQTKATIAKCKAKIAAHPPTPIARERRRRPTTGGA